MLYSPADTGGRMERSLPRRNGFGFRVRVPAIFTLYQQKNCAILSGIAEML